MLNTVMSCVNKFNECPTMSVVGNEKEMKSCERRAVTSGVELSLQKGGIAL